jgi:hypothetical protein
LSRTITLTAAVAAAILIGVAPASASTSASGDVPRPIAHASGSDAAAIIPSIVQTRTTRVDNAIERLTDYVDDGDTVGVDRTGKVIRRQLAAAWRGAVYYVKNPPPPVAEDAQDDGGPTVADPVTTAMSVFDSYHSVAATIGQLVDGARVPVLDAMSTTLFWTLNARDRAITAAHTLEGPPPEEGEGGEDAAPTFATSMPLAIPSLDDEMQQIKGLQSDATDLRPGGKTVLTRALAQTQATETTINTLWPPVIEG